MINPVNAMKVFNERKTFIQNHPEFFDFVVGKFGEELPTDTVIELKVVTPDGEERSASAKLCETDQKILEALRNLIR